MHRRHHALASLAALLLAAGAVAFVLGQGDVLLRLVGEIGSIDPAVAVLGVVTSGLAIVNRGLLNRASHRAVGLVTGVADMTHTAAVGFAAQKLVKSGGAIGLAVFVRHGRRRGHAAGAVVAAGVIAAAASFAALGVLMTMAIVVLAATGDLTGWWAAAAIGFAIYTMLVVVAGVVLVRSRPLAEVLWRRGQRAAHRIRRRPAAPVTPLPAGLFEAVDLARRRPGAVGRVLAHAVLSKTLGALMLALAVVAVGLPTGFADALVIYATALAASLVSIVPGGVGTVEGSMVALLVGAGATAGVAALAVALFRLFDLWMPVVTGVWAAGGELRRSAGPAPDELDPDVELVELTRTVTIGPVVPAAPAVAAIAA